MGKRIKRTTLKHFSLVALSTVLFEEIWDASEKPTFFIEMSLMLGEKRVEKEGDQGSARTQNPKILKEEKQAATRDTNTVNSQYF